MEETLARARTAIATLVALLAALGAPAARGADEAAARAGDPEPGVPTLEALMHGMASTPGVAARFREVKELALLSEPLEVEGHLYFVPPDRLARTTTEPTRSRLVIDGHRFAYRDAAGGEQLDLSSNPVARTFVENFIVLFNGDLDGLRARYEPRFETDGPRWTLELRPRRAPLRDVIERVTLAGEGRRLVRVEMLETGGDRTTTHFEAVEVDRRFGPEEQARIFAIDGDGW